MAGHKLGKYLCFSQFGSQTRQKAGGGEEERIGSNCMFEHLQDFCPEEILKRKKGFVFNKVLFGEGWRETSVAAVSPHIPQPGCPAQG